MRYVRPFLVGVLSAAAARAEALPPIVQAALRAFSAELATGSA